MSLVLNGKSIFGGIAIGKIKVFKDNDVAVKRNKIEDADIEIRRYEAAKEAAITELWALHDKAVADIGEVNAQIFEVHAMMLEDDDYNDSVIHMIQTQMVGAEFAVAVTGDSFAEMFANMDDDYMKARAADIKDISNRLIRQLTGCIDEEEAYDEPVILVAQDLAPSQTVQLDKNKVLSFVTELGSTNSHTAILARTMNIPALIGIHYPEDIDGKQGIVDGYKGCLLIDPDEEEFQAYKQKLAEEEYRKALLLNLKGMENVTLDGTKIHLYANIGSAKDVTEVLENDAGGIGLLRSEFLYLEETDYPTEEMLFNAYKFVASAMAGRKVIIRTLDIGADKQAGYFNLPEEDNPAMGYRAIRICLDRKDVFKTQLRAIYRASYYGNISIMFPMIISLAEVREIKKLILEVKEELSEAQILYNDCEIGLMIETPAAVMISDLLAKEVDFFSIGTNDLTQYTLAIDRQNPKLDNIYEPHHEAVLRMIELVVNNAHQENCWVGICGELGADTEMTETFLRMGVDELSVSPSMVLPVREKIRSLDLSK